MNFKKRVLGQRITRPLANISFAVMNKQVRAIERSGISMMHTARPFWYYRRVFFQGQSATSVLDDLKGKVIADIGCGYTPFADDSMFQACNQAGIEFYGVDPLLANQVKIDFKDRLLARAMGSKGNFSNTPAGMSNAVSAYADALPFTEQSVDQILTSFLLFVWIKDEAALSKILREFLRVLKPGGVAKLYPLPDWRLMQFENMELIDVLKRFTIKQSFVHGGLDFRVTPAMLTVMGK
jgi:ubiquinone/menaquinone biosynthesis C-methylase UbiE